jgi:hypothetical protein
LLQATGRYWKTDERCDPRLIGGIDSIERCHK